MATEQSSTDYDAFLDDVRRVSNLEQAGQLLSWDQQVTMPEGGTPARSKQLSTLSQLSHEVLTSEEMGAALDDLEGDDGLDDDQRAVVREVRREHDRAASVPGDLVERISETASEALPIWQEAKANDDFEHFAPTLERLVELKREYANHVDPEADPYAVLFADYEPYLDLETAERVLGRLREELVPLIEAVEASDADLTTRREAFPDTYDADTQESLVRDALTTLGYPWDRGRLDTAPHPFSTGNQFDARVTTRFDESDPLDALTSTIHEFGHATYTLGLPEEHYGTPLGSHRNLSVHESQSRLWENHVGRTRAFWEHFLPTLHERFPATTGLGVDEVYEAANQVFTDNPIRVEADELTYHMHVLLRFEIERDLVSGDLAVEDVPGVWNEKMEEYLGVRPESDAEGCLQDIHWSHGNFGYFPTYSLGSVLAAQLDAAARAEIPDLDAKTMAGEFGPLHEWLTDAVHRHGQRYTTDGLVEAATGEPLTADYFVEYVTSKYGELYDL
jgi:carboxypeptidase Taq